jgi:hypothetical protein
LERCAEWAERYQVHALQKSKSRWASAMAAIILSLAILATTWKWNLPYYYSRLWPTIKGFFQMLDSRKVIELEFLYMYICTEIHVHLRRLKCASLNHQSQLTPCFPSSAKWKKFLLNLCHLMSLNSMVSTPSPPRKVKFP